MFNPYLLAAVAQAQPEGNPVVGWLIIGGVIWMLIAIFSKKKDRYAVSQATSVRKLP